MKKDQAWSRLAQVLAAGLLAMAGAAAAQPTAGSSCYETSCRAQDGATVGGSCYGHYCGAGYAGTKGGDCTGNGCNAGNGSTLGGNCVGDGCKAGAGWNRGGDCYGQGCTPGRGGNVSGKAHPAKNTACLLGEIYRFPTSPPGERLVNWGTPVGAACQPVNIGPVWLPNLVQINPVPVPSPAPAPVAVTPLPPNP